MPTVLLVEVSSYLGGAEKVLRDLLQDATFRQEVEIVLACSSDLLKQQYSSLVTFSKPLAARRFSWRKELEMLRDGFTYFWTFAQLIRMIQKHRVELVHANSLNAHIYSALAARLCGVPNLWHMHDILRPCQRNRVLVKVMAALATRIIAVSEAVKGSLIALGAPARKIEVVYNGLDARPGGRSASHACLRERWGLPTDAFVFLHLGQISHWKAPHLFIDAFLSTGLDESVYAVVAGGTAEPQEVAYRDALVESIQARSSVNVRFVGWQRDPYAAVAAADVVVHTSIAPDPFPTVILEAMAMSRPVIATAIGGAPEAVSDGETGLLIPAGDERALAAALRFCAGHREQCAEMGQRARKRLAAHFSMGKKVQRLLSIYTELLERPRYADRH